MATKPFDEMKVNWITQPDMLGKATVGVTLCLGVLSTLLVIVRVWTRQHTRAIGVDDYLMVAGLAIFIACCISTSFAVYAGMGTIDSRLQEWNKVAGTKGFVLFQVTYSWSLPFVKSSICFTVFRITTHKIYRFILWGVMIASTLSTTVGFIAVVASCRPISYTWDKSIRGKCAPAEIITCISYVVSVLVIVTDWTCAIVPTVVIWRLQMKSRVKASACAILALGAIASAATIIRLPYLQYYSKPEDYLYAVADNMAKIVIWSIFECGIGIIAGSLPSLRRLLRSWIDKSSYGSHSNDISNYLNTGSACPGTNDMQLDSLGRRGNTFSNCQTGHRDTWDQLDDDNSQRNIIIKTQEVSVEISKCPEQNSSRKGLSFS
ncbi:cation-transporting atpase 4 [Colletotrichum truncatum]|uniref:Cation-transporting atpase 4 n=1 Tax=Colletotrichum truncatum TaxID=5467 RepID=A0ACC3YK33_COLTU|nr:cation-transporting atpase 4 [Colletotrichum truncatum]KAF6784338.1 cation-transporting atpase 4 [Colletotrichum truncatum]